jgi:cytochrome P450
VNAGSDTTAIAMNNALYNLLRNPSCLTKLRAELATVLSPTERVAPYEKVRHLPYLRACLDESLRLSPPTTFNLPRRTPSSPSAPTIIANNPIPPSTSVSISALIAHQDPTLYPSPTSFLPERWLAPNAKELQQGFIAFSTGARGCIGRNISYLEQTVLLASVVHRYGFALPWEGWAPEVWEAMNCMPGEMWLKVWRRRGDGGEGIGEGVGDGE